MTTVASYRILRNATLRVSVAKEARREGEEENLKTRRVKRERASSAVHVLISPPRFPTRGCSRKRTDFLCLFSQRGAKTARARGCLREFTLGFVNRLFRRSVGRLTGWPASRLTSLLFFFRTTETRSWHQDIVITRERPLFPHPFPLHRRPPPPLPAHSPPRNGRRTWSFACCE